MKFRFLLILLAAISVFEVSAQCTLCTVDEAVHPQPIDDYSLGLLPDTITVQAGVDTCITMQFLLPKKIDITSPINGTANINSVTLISVLNLPPQTSNFCWQANEADNTYEPQNYRYGCAMICINTLAPAGYYTSQISVNGQGCIGSICDQQGLSLPVVINVLPPQGNPYFSQSATVGCDSLTVDFEETLPAYPVNSATYAWDFGNGTTASGSTASSTFIGQGDYVITLTETVQEFYISGARVTLTNNGCWTGDVEELTALSSPEPYLIINGVNIGENGSGTTINWTNLNIPLNGASIDIHAWEADNGPPFGSADDDLDPATSTISPTPATNGQQAYFSNNCVTGFVTLSSNFVTHTYTDTFSILPPSAVPTISQNGVGCPGDTVVLTSTPSGSYQWYKDSVMLVGETNQTLNVTANGDYYVVVTDAGTVCSATSLAYNFTYNTIDEPVIMASSAGLYVDNPNGYDVQWYANGSGTAVPIPNATLDTLATFNPNNQPFTVMFTSSVGCTALSTPFTLCVAGTSEANGTEVSLSAGVTLTHDGFVLNAGNDVAWAISTEADGAIEDMTALQVAIDAGWVLPASNDSSIILNCSNLPAGLDEGNYYFTPISAEALVIDSIIHQPNVDSGCITNAELCLEISATPGVLLVTDSLIFTFPDGSTADLRQIVPADFQALLPDTIDITLIQLLPSIIPGGSLCFPLTGLYSGDPNGTWSIEALNVGTGSLTLDVPDIVSTVFADSCPLITQDQVITIPGFTVNIAPNSSSSVSFTLPPLPSSFPTISPACNVFGEATMLAINCETGIQTVIDEGSLSLYPNPNNGSFTLKMDILKESKVQYSVYDVSGRNIFNKNMGNQTGMVYETVNIQNNIGTGFYVIRIDIDGNLVQKHFIVK